MKGPDLDKARSEEKHSLASFLAAYNAGLPAGFPRASAPLLETFRKAYPTHFKGVRCWSLDVHRKKVMDWLPAYLKNLEQ